jgi:integrase
VSAKFAFIDAEKAPYSIVKMCAWMGVSTSGFYEWRDRPASATARRRDRLATLIEWIFNDSDQTYGHRGIYKIVRRHAGQLDDARTQRQVSPHTFRHTAAVHLLEAGVEVNVIRGWLGHADLTTTNRYAEINTRGEDRGAAKHRAARCLGGTAPSSGLEVRRSPTPLAVNTLIVM